MLDAGIEVLWDERDKRPGEKFGDSDLIGIPNRVVISPKSLEAGGVEFKKRNESEGKIISEEELFQILK
jgi:prolyl-tRNA synthetase